MRSVSGRFVLGVDEAGRGPLAGPVAVGIVMVPRAFDVAREFPGVADSKRLTQKAREALFALLEARAEQGDVRFRVELESARAIDRGGISAAVRRALFRGVRALAADHHEIERIFLDGLLRAPRRYPQETIVRGDELVPLISLASIAAKVARDRLMVALAKRHPEYGFERHKGYGTDLHYARLRELGPCAIHRRTYLRLDFSCK